MDGVVRLPHFIWIWGLRGQKCVIAHTAQCVHRGVHAFYICMAVSYSIIHVQTGNRCKWGCRMHMELYGGKYTILWNISLVARARVILAAKQRNFCSPLIFQMLLYQILNCHMGVRGWVRCGVGRECVCVCVFCVCVCVCVWGGGGGGGGYVRVLLSVQCSKKQHDSHIAIGCGSWSFTHCLTLYLHTFISG